MPEYAAQYGDSVIAIEIDESKADHIQECPLSPMSCSECEKCPLDADGEAVLPANEFVIEYGVTLDAWFVK